MSNLPCGVTDAMCEPNDPPCGSCGHAYSDHYYEDGDEEIYEHEALNIDQAHEDQCIQYNSRGEVIHACDILEGIKGNKHQCDCTEFSDHEYEPEVFQEYD